MVTPLRKIIFIVIHNCNLAAVMNLNVSICVSLWSQVTPKTEGVVTHRLKIIGLIFSRPWAPQPRPYRGAERDSGKVNLLSLLQTYGFGSYATLTFPPKITFSSQTHKSIPSRGLRKHRYIFLCSRFKTYENLAQTLCPNPD